MGKCPECGAWDSYEEEQPRTKKRESQAKGSFSCRLGELPDISSTDRFVSGLNEFDRVLGGGIFPKSIVLLSGGPGIGKSTLMLQVSDALVGRGRGVMYVSAEESSFQIKDRALRLDVDQDVMVSGENRLEGIVSLMRDPSFDVMIIDSVQTIYDGENESAPGTVSQIRNSLLRIREEAMANGKAVVVIGHINKSGDIAGPMFLEHMVDAVMIFEGDEKNQWRILRAKKNRYGSTQEIGVFVMGSDGLSEVTNPSTYFINDNEFLSGCATGSIMEGIRPLFLEVQALASKTVYAMPQRISNGYEARSLSILLAVLEKRLGYQVGKYDIFLNIAGGLRVNETSVGAAVMMAVVSSLLNRELDRWSLFVGEVGLSGEIRKVPFMDRRVDEAAKIGYKKIYAPDTDINSRDGVQIIKCRTVGDMIKYAWGV